MVGEELEKEETAPLHIKKSEGEEGGGEGGEGRGHHREGFLVRSASVLLALAEFSGLWLLYRE